MNNPLNIVNTTSSCGSNKEQSSEERQLKIQWEGSQCFIGGQRFYPKIAPTPEITKDVHNAVVIRLDGQTKSELNWNEELALADKLIEKGYKVLWSIDLGLFNRLPFSLLNKSQLMTLSIAIEHFLDNVWPKYDDQTIGIILYQGTLDFSCTIPWSEDLLRDLRSWLEESYNSIEVLNQQENLSLKGFDDINQSVLKETELLHLYTADLCMNYLDILAGRIPEEIACFAFIDATPISSPLLQARMLTAERAEHVRFVVKNGVLPVQDISWDSPASPYGYYASGSDALVDYEKPPLGVCLPEISYVQNPHYEGLNQAMKHLMDEGIPFRVIPEALLTSEWDGLDDLIVTSTGVSVWGHRKLQGFCAAGGRIVTIGSSLEGVEEISFEEWLNQHKMRV